MMGININCSKYDFITMILDGSKTVETRNSRSLDPYLGKRVGLIETGRGKAMLWGYATITARYKWETQEAFDDAYFMHRVIPGSEYDFNGNTKYGYLLENVVMCEPRYINSKGIVARQL